MDHAVESLAGSSSKTNAADDDAADIQSPVAGNSPQVTSDVPSVHIDIQIHIDSSASTDQVDQMFRSMAEHLYGRRE